MKVRVAFFADILIRDFDGAARTMFQLIDRIPAAEFEFLFIYGTGPEKIGEFRCIQCPALQIPGNKSYRMAFPRVKKRKITAAVRVFDPHVVHIATPSFLGHFALDLAIRLNRPVLSIYHTHFKSYLPYYLKSFAVPPVRKLLVRLQNRFYNRCTRVYVPSESLAAELRADGLSPDHLQLWRRGIDKTLFTPEKRDRAFMNTLTGNDRPVILFASRLVWEKNLQVLIALYDLIRERNLPYNLLITGDGVAAGKCRSEMPHAVFTGQADHQTLARIYASADVFFFPSVTETFGNVVLEAMASGLPCVIADKGGSKDLIVPGRNGYLCAAGDAAAYLEKIEQILRNPELKKKLSENAVADTALLDWDYLAGIYFNDLKQMAFENI